MGEAKRQQQILLASDDHEMTLWRNNVGLGWCGNLESNDRGRVVLTSARAVRFGLCKGSSDLIGLTRVTITPDMVGKRLAVFTTPEAKTPHNRMTKEQQKFNNFVAMNGGIAGAVREPDDLSKLVDNFKTQLLKQASR